MRLREVWNRCPDVWTALLLAVIAGAAGYAYLVFTVNTVGYAYKFSTSYLVPSAMYASGHGYIAPPYGAIPALDAFINEATPKLDLPANLDVSGYPKADWFYQDHWYLFVSVGWIWRLFGVSWTAYKLLPALFLALTAICAFALFRLVAGRFLSSAGTVVFLASPAVLSVLPALRDFSKAPFILAIFFGLLWLGSRAVSKRTLLLAALALGALNGFGLGIRSDLLVCVPPALAVLALAVKGRETPLGWRPRVAAIGLFLAAFVVAGSPVLLHKTDQGSSPAHHITCGLAPECNVYLGIEPASYETVYYFGDAYTHALANSYAHRVLGIEEQVPYLTTLSQEGQWGFVADVFLRFPGDLITRMYASTLRILGAGFTRVEAYGYPGNVVVDASETIMTPLAVVLEFTKLLLPAIVFLGIAALNLRAAFTGLLLFLFFTGYACLQFHLRHYFHLTLASLWFLAAFLSAWPVARSQWRDAETRRVALRRVAVFALVACALLTVPWYGARAFQVWRLARYTDQLAAAQTVPLETIRGESDGRTTLLLASPIPHAPESNGDQVWEVQTDYIMVALTPSAETRELRIEYEAETTFNDFSLTVQVPPAPNGEAVHYYFPIFQSLYHSVGGVPNPFEGFDGRWGKSVFSSVSMDARHNHVMTGLYKVEDIGPYSVLLNLSMSAEGGVLHSWQRAAIFLPETAS